MHRQVIKPIYSGVFFGDDECEGLDLHMTYDYNPKSGPRYPESRINHGDKQIVVLTGIINMNGIIAYSCYFKSVHKNLVYRRQHNSDTPLHITIHCGSKTKPVESGRLLKGLSVESGILNHEYVDNYRSLLPNMELKGYWGCHYTK